VHEGVGNDQCECEKCGNLENLTIREAGFERLKRGGSETAINIYNLSVSDDGIGILNVNFFVARIEHLPIVRIHFSINVSYDFTRSFLTPRY